LPRWECTYEDLIELIRTITKRDAAEVFHCLIAGMDVGSIVKHVMDGSLLMQLSLVPKTTRQFEFTYIAKMPSHLFVSNNLYLPYKAGSSSSAYTNAENKQLLTNMAAHTC
jgi:hypothetical protein